MIIDIDIKIKNSDGSLLHRIERRIDENNNSSSENGKNFEDFLAEYMTFHGRVMREKLTNNYTVTASNHRNQGFMKDNNLYMGKETSDMIKESELEYRIHFGSSKVFYGKIPLSKSNKNNTAEDTQNKEAMEDTNRIQEAENKKKIENINKAKVINNNGNLDEAENLVENEGVSDAEKFNDNDYAQTFNYFNERYDYLNGYEADFNRIVRNAMIKAIEKYEVNLIQTNEIPVERI